MSIYRITIRGHMQTGEEWNTTWHVDVAGGQALNVANAAHDAITAAWSGVTGPAGRLDAYYTADIGVDSVDAVELGDSSHGVDKKTVSLALVGTSTDELLPPNNAVAVSLRTNVPTKSGRGRNFLASPVVTTVVNQLLATAVQTAIKNAWLRALTSMSNAGFPVGIFHRETGGWDQVISCDVGDVFDTQNRRRNQQEEIRVSSNVP